ncbi:putative zinc-binding oxidoreductase, mitochondrial [Pseudocercospora fuligena]|uniref:Putative zinc-binding oxidoreductase, mitochondrial n=1 Tax=Pseudocercospora fuligena TaxID=685502 RepID=A0A8H6VH45_9PEZI|nr:putative zinc-binding oxidoreductase, mitochondrial [Pseudocercospora fuligena]
MKALIHDQATQALTISDACPIPTAKAHEHLLKVYATGITTGELYWPRPPELQQSHPGVEMCGSVVTAPSGSRFSPGDRIYMRTTYPRAGSARVYSIGLDHELRLAPKNVTAEEAASVPVSALTAWQGLFEYAGLKPSFDEKPNGEAPSNPLKLFVNGGSSGVGLWYIQLAHALGHYIVATCSTKNISLVENMGANEVIDYTKTSIREWNSHHNIKFDHVFDCVGLHKTPDCWHLGDKVWTIVLPPGEITWPPKWILDVPEGISEGVTGRFFVMEPNGEQLAKIAKLIEDGVAKPNVDSVWSLEEYEKAFERLDSGRAVGKVILKVADENENENE